MHILVTICFHQSRGILLVIKFLEARILLIIVANKFVQRKILAIEGIIIFDTIEVYLLELRNIISLNHNEHSCLLDISQI